MSNAWQQFLNLMMGGKNDTPVQSGHNNGYVNDGTSHAWQAFLKHYNADPREKDNGYYRFEGMSPDELLQAEKLLIQTAKELEVEEIQALGQLNTPGAQRCIEELFESADSWKQSKRSYVFLNVCASGWLLTQDPRYTKPIYDSLYVKNNDQLECALSIIDVLLPVTPEIYQQLKTLLLGKPSLMVISTLAQTTMKYFGLGTVWGQGYQENEPIIKALSDKDPQIRATTLAELEQKYQKY